ncbi:MAG: CBS domain-containing protein [Acidobacteriota bacterium]
MTVSELMTTGVQTVSPGTPLANARDRMRRKEIHHLLVQKGDQVVGVLSARDLGRNAHPGNTTKGRLVADVMTPRVVTVEQATSVHRAANLMRGHSIGCLIVLEQGRAVGILTVADLLDHVGGRRRHRRDTHTPPALHFRVPHKKQHRAGGAW